MDQNSSRVVAGESNTGRNGLVCQYQFEDGSSQFIFLQVGDKNGAVDIDRSLSFCTENYVQAISSCKGLLLLSSIGDLGLKYHVLDSMSRGVSTLPQPAITRRIIRSGLAFDGLHYQVVLVHVADAEETPDGLEMEIYSSETGIWTKFHPNGLFSPVPVPDFEFSELKTPPLFSNGAIHWEINGHLLVYQVEVGYCELIELPNSLEDWCWQSTMTYKRCLSESQGRIHYTYTDLEGIHSWILLNEEDHDCYSFNYPYDRRTFRWALAHSVSHQDLNLKHEEIYPHIGQGNREPYDASPLSLSEDSETLYLQLPGFLVSYNTTTKVIEEVCTYIFPGINFNCCLFFPFMYGKQIQAETAGKSLEVGVVELPIKEKLDKLAF
ncbi:uncharacterized protein LOC110606343 [Manihot esculenta]|uniref:F-box protein At3g26010-like beta-propeller domain-containing protein n=1 Tax=Manihot esculenta TaxID=3983 RepID=A0A2C9U2N3_MANES|nr:uncharacterized protein LOC110606343 [Manihot esculenta]OAY23805.1 hypothetical protein MANES_18G108700v8 [Manihot esculenta]